MGKMWCLQNGLQHAIKFSLVNFFIFIFFKIFFNAVTASTVEN